MEGVEEGVQEQGLAWRELPWGSSIKLCVEAVQKDPEEEEED